jgi:iron(III) transport system ATP-binding protein
MSNVVRGKTLAEGRVDFAGVPLRVSNAAPRSSGDTAISIRQHSIRLMATEPAEKDNVVPATVVRQVFLGASRDYLVEVADGTQLRVVTPSGDAVPPGASVWLHLPQDSCRALIS